MALIAGGGILPLEFLRSAAGRKDEVVVFAIKGAALPEIEKEAKKVYWVDFGEFAKFLFLMARERVKNVVFLGKIRKEGIYDYVAQDSKVKALLRKTNDRKDYSLLKGITEHLARIGIMLIDPSEYLAHLLAQKGVLTPKKPSPDVMEDVDFGFSAAKKIAAMDIGQTVVVKGRSVVAVEAMEGTDKTIERAYEIAGPGCVMVKVARPDQDMRWDIPTIGPATVLRLARCGYAALAAESGKMFILEQDEFSKIASANDISIVIL